MMHSFIESAVLKVCAWYVRNLPSHPGQWRVARMAVNRSQALAREPRPVTFRVKDGFRLRTDGSSQTGRIAYATGTYEPGITRLLRGCLRSGDTFVDVGANIGYFSLLASRTVGPDGQVIAFEPSTVVRRALAENLRLNDTANVHIREEALAASEGLTRFFVGPSTNTGLASLRPLEQGRSIEVRQRRFDDLHEAKSRLALVKIDVEGGELGVLEGMTRTIRRDQPALIVEFTDQFLRALGASAESLYAFVRDNGYRVWLIPDDGALVEIRSPAALRRCPAQFNAFCSVSSAAERGAGA
jgi:FkbM family methyltransferase